MLTSKKLTQINTTAQGHRMQAVSCTTLEPFPASTV